MRAGANRPAADRALTFRPVGRSHRPLGSRVRHRREAAHERGDAGEHGQGDHHDEGDRRSRPVACPELGFSPAFLGPVTTNVPRQNARTWRIPCDAAPPTVRLRVPTPVLRAQRDVARAGQPQPSPPRAAAVRRAVPGGPRAGGRGGRGRVRRARKPPRRRAQDGRPEVRGGMGQGRPPRDVGAHRRGHEEGLSAEALQRDVPGGRARGDGRNRANGAGAGGARRPPGRAGQRPHAQLRHAARQRRAAGGQRGRRGRGALAAVPAAAGPAAGRERQAARALAPAPRGDPRRGRTKPRPHRRGVGDRRQGAERGEPRQRPAAPLRRPPRRPARRRAALRQPPHQAREGPPRARRARDDQPRPPARRPAGARQPPRRRRGPAPARRVGARARGPRGLRPAAAGLDVQDHHRLGRAAERDRQADEHLPGADGRAAVAACSCATRATSRAAARSSTPSSSRATRSSRRSARSSARNDSWPPPSASGSTSTPRDPLGEGRAGSRSRAR